jgi:hypothetical protein
LPSALPPRHLVLPLCMALAAALAGCSGAVDVLEGREQAFTKPIFQVPDWAKAARAQAPPLGPSGPVAAEELVDASGHCAPAVASAPAAPAAAEPPPAAEPENPPAPAAPPAYGSLAGDLAGPRMPQPPAPPPTPVAAKPSDRLERLQPEGPGAAPSFKGGIALGMTECEAVRRAGPPSNVSIGSGDKGERKVVLTYASGAWPGIYTFAAGRLKEIAAVPQPDKLKPAPQKKKPKRAPPRTAASERMYVQ